MVFKRIEMQGFKSFADKTEIDFLTGVTGIVGPNGCGKSNIADGVRWVLGEQSTKTLRGKSMTDVIFSGTEKRKRHGFAEVSLIFDNKTALFDLPYNEIYFTRKIYGDGESEYLINKKQARMKDIQALLSGIGIGKEGYSIIGQGRVEQIISAKPEDRRVIFEEASGIAGTKRKKQESERKLERSRENRERLLDIIKEQERTLKPLEKQAANAQVYLKLRDRLKHLEINNFIYRFETTSETKKNLSVKIKTVSKELEDKTKELEKLNVQYVETAAEINAIDSSLAKIHEEILNLSLSLERSEGDTKLSRERLEFFRTQYESLTAEVLELEKTQRQIKEEIDQGSFEIRQKNMDLKGLSRDKEEATKTYLEIIDALTAGEDELSKNQNALYLSLETLADVKAAISEEEARIEISTQRTKDLETQIQLEEGKKERATEDLRQAKIKLAAVEEGIRAMLNKRSETLKALNTLRTEVAELEEEVGILKTRESVSSNRLKLLKDIKESGEGYGHSVKRLMDAGRMHPEVKRLYDGTVGSLFKTTERYEVAIETALGSAISNIIVHSEEDAKKLIGLMKKNNMGRLTFLPTLSVKPRNIKREYESAVRELAVANAVDVISFDKAHRSVFESLLGGTVVCENLDRAVRLAQRTGYDFKIVTLDGEVLSTAGAISGGSRKNEGTSVISRDREIEELEKTVKETQEAYAKKSSLLTDKRLERIAKERELEVIVEQIKKIEIEENNFKNAAEVKNSSANLAMENINSLTKEKATEAKTIKDAQTKIDGIRIRQNSIMSGKAHADESMLIRQKQFENLKIERDKFNEIITDTKVKIAHVEKEIAAINDTNFRLDNQREEIEKKLIAAIDAKQKTEKTIESQEKLLLEKSKEKGGNKTAEQLETVRTKLRTMDTYKKEKSDSLVLTEERRQRLSQEVTSIAEKKFNEE
ncbi:MAG: chromosome segregation protein SMC [Firmicutes bacterium]|nr:chromosome segregation protein SMC [Bacillota bacterium]